MGLQVGEPTEGGKGVGLVGEAEGGFVAAETIVAVEPAGQPEAVDYGPEIVGRVLCLGRAYRGGPAPVGSAVELGARQRPALAADGGMDSLASVGGGRLHEAVLALLK
jgi:hypothetical protein